MIEKQLSGLKSREKTPTCNIAQQKLSDIMDGCNFVNWIYKYDPDINAEDCIMLHPYFCKTFYDLPDVLLKRGLLAYFKTSLGNITYFTGDSGDKYVTKPITIEKSKPIRHMYELIKIGSDNQRIKIHRIKKETLYVLLKYSDIKLKDLSAKVNFYAKFSDIKMLLEYVGLIINPGEEAKLEKMKLNKTDIHYKIPNISKTNTKKIWEYLHRAFGRGVSCIILRYFYVARA